MDESVSLILADAEATEAFAGRMAAAVLSIRPASFVTHLEGELGTGKTTLVRGFLAALGHSGRVPSPTYTLVEPYRAAGYPVYHIDLYRLRDFRELDELDLPAMLSEGVSLIEWASHGGPGVPSADIVVRLDFADGARSAVVQSRTSAGARVLSMIVSSRA